MRTRFLFLDDPPTYNLQSRILAFAREHALPVLAPYREVVEDGALISYGERFEDAALGVVFVPRQDRPGREPVRATDHATDFASS
jgi:hypothetical protein